MPVFSLQLPLQILLSLAPPKAGEPNTDDNSSPETDTTASVTIVVKRPRIDANENRLDAETARQTPGTQGDTVRALQTLPGIGRPSPNQTHLVVFGASPSHTRVYVDGVPVPRLFHAGGHRSILPSAIVSSLRLVPGGYNAAFGRAIGGFVDVETTPVQTPLRGSHQRDWGVQAHLNPLDVGAVLSTKLGSKIDLRVSARRSAIDLWFEHVAPTDVSPLYIVPEYQDYQAKLRYRINSSDSLDVAYLAASDQVQRTRPGSSLHHDLGESENLQFHRIAATFERDDTHRATHTKAVMWVGIDEKTDDRRFKRSDAFEHQKAQAAGLRVERKHQTTEVLSLVGGFDLELQHTQVTRSGALTLPPREGDIYVFGQPPGDRVNEDQWSVTSASAGLFAIGSLSLLNKKLSLSPGVRFEPSVISGDRVVPVRGTEPPVGYVDLHRGLDPRFQADWTFRDWVGIYAAGGRYHQLPNPTDLSPVFGNPRLGFPKAWHAVGGLRFDFGDRLSLDANGFQIVQSQLPVRSPISTPATAQLLTSIGLGRNYGAQLRASSWLTSRLQTTLSYSWTQSLRRDHPRAAWRHSDVSQLHNVQAIALWSHEAGLEIGGHAQFTSGLPRTPVVDSVFNSKDGSFDPVYGVHNSIRLTPYFQVSLRLGWKKQWRASSMRVTLDLQNLTNRKNSEELVYNFDYSQRATLTGLPFLPFLGLEISI